MSTEDMLRFDNVTVRRQERVAVEGVSLVVRRGSIHTIVGPNGAGKSTLIAALLGGLPFEGRISIAWSRTPTLGLVPQRIALDARAPITVRDFLAAARQRWPVALYTRRSVRARIDAMLDAQGLHGFATRRLGALSGGETQRVLLAHALDPEPELLVLDEPTTGLDPASQAHLESALVAARARGVTVLAILHDLALAQRIADDATHLDRRVIASGSAAEVLRAPQLPSNGRRSA